MGSLELFVQPQPTQVRRSTIEMPASLSSHPDVSIPSDILSQPQEERIQLALAAIRQSGTKSNGDSCYSARQAAWDFGVPRSTLGRRLQGEPYYITHLLYY